MENKPRCSKLDEITDAINLEWVVNDIYASLPQKNIDLILQSELPTDMYDYHFSLGKHVRNYYGLWNNENPLPKWFQQNTGLSHADDMSGIILEALWHHVKGLEYDPQATIDSYQQHWNTIDVTEQTK